MTPLLLFFLSLLSSSRYLYAIVNHGTFIHVPPAELVHDHDPDAIGAGSACALSEFILAE